MTAKSEENNPKWYDHIIILLLWAVVVFLILKLQGKI